MSDAAKRKAATAASQAKHAAVNVEKAAALQTDEVVQQAVKMARPAAPLAKDAAVAGVIFLTGVGAYHVGTKVKAKLAQRRAEKKAAEATKVRPIRNNAEAS